MKFDTMEGNRLHNMFDTNSKPLFQFMWQPYCVFVILLSFVVAFRRPVCLLGNFGRDGQSLQTSKKTANVPLQSPEKNGFENINVIRCNVNIMVQRSKATQLLFHVNMAISCI